jgi:uncharacterized surface protein with fasciclin (FAS1) repeats
MKKLIKYTGATIAILGLTSLSAVADDHGDKKAAKSATADKTVVEIAAGNESFTTLVAAVKAAGLAEALSGTGPFTIFAPTNEAFAKLPKGTVETLLKPENKDKLAGILKYHVVSGKVMAADVKAMKVKTLQGSEFEITIKEGAVMVDGAKVVKTDIVGKNGVIHVIDSVILPK